MLLAVVVAFVAGSEPDPLAAAEGALLACVAEPTTLHVLVDADGRGTVTDTAVGFEVHDCLSRVVAGLQWEPGGRDVVETVELGRRPVAPRVFTPRLAPRGGVGRFFGDERHRPGAQGLHSPYPTTLIGSPSIAGVRHPVDEALVLWAGSGAFLLSGAGSLLGHAGPYGAVAGGAIGAAVGGALGSVPGERLDVAVATTIAAPVGYAVGLVPGFLGGIVVGFFLLPPQNLGVGENAFGKEHLVAGSIGAGIGGAWGAGLAAVVAAAAVQELVEAE